MDRYCGPAPERQSGRMVDSFRIKNFRGFDSIEVKDCRLINLIVGDNGSGKTAMLEALFLAAGVSPELMLRAGSWRGQELEKMHGSLEDIEFALWETLFFRFRTGQNAIIQLRGEGEQERKVEVRVFPRGKMRVIPPSRNKPGSPPRTVPEPHPVEFRWDIRGLPPFSVYPRIENGRLTFTPSPARVVKASFHASARMPPASEPAARFSDLSQRFQEKSFIKAFHALYEPVYDISVELGAGIASLYGAFDQIPRKLPLSIVSGGMNKLVAILLSITEHEDGIVLIDEIENGFYHKRLREIWRAILIYARQYRCQIFASTHSDECLRAVAELAKESPDDFSLMRTVRTPDGSIVRRFDGPSFTEAVLDDVDVR
jgi:hypothetical protein